jgi:ABC-2 type transport system ATP-binding protein
MAVEARGLVKRFGDTQVVDGIDLTVREGSIFGLLGPNGAGKTTLIRMLLGIIDPDAGRSLLLGRSHPLKLAHLVGYLPEERGLYPTMKAVEAIAFMGALRGLKLGEGRQRAHEMLESHGLGHAADRQIRHLSKGMAQSVQLLGAIVHRPRLIILDEPFSGLDALNQQKLEAIIRAQAEAGVTILFSTHIISHAERICEEIAIIAGGRCAFSGTVDDARGRLPPQVRLETRAKDGEWRAALPADARREGREWHFSLPQSGIEPLLRALIDGEAGIVTMSIERPSLHDAFVAITGAAMPAAEEEAER